MGSIAGPLYKTQPWDRRRTLLFGDAILRRTGFVLRLAERQQRALSGPLCAATGLNQWDLYPADFARCRPAHQVSLFTLSLNDLGQGL